MCTAFKFIDLGLQIPSIANHAMRQCGLVSGTSGNRPVPRVALPRLWPDSCERSSQPVRGPPHHSILPARDRARRYAQRRKAYHHRARARPGGWIPSSFFPFLNFRTKTTRCNLILLQTGCTIDHSSTTRCRKPQMPAVRRNYMCRKLLEVRTFNHVYGPLPKISVLEYRPAPGSSGGR